MATGTEHRRSPHARRVELLLALLVVVIAGPLVHDNGAQQASRYTLTAAIWDEHTLNLDMYAALDEPVLGVDRAVRDGSTYSDKAPLQPMLAVPFYAAYRAVGGEPATVRRVEEHLGLWWVTFWMATVPAALLVVLMHRFVRRRYATESLPASFGLFIASMLLPFAALLFGHVLAAFLLFGALSVVDDDAPGARRVLAAGVLAGAAVAIDYTAVLGVIVLAGFLLWRVRARIGWYVLGGLPSVALLAWYHDAAFGSPFTHPYRFSAFNDVTQEARGFFAIFRGFEPVRIVELLFDGRGFLFASPLVIVAVVGLFVAQRETEGTERAVVWTAFAMFGAFLLIPLFWANPWGGDSPGPRYMTPMLPFLVVGLAAVWTRAGIWARFGAVLGGLTMVLATLTNPLLSDEARVSIGSWISLASDGDIVPTVFTIAIGPLGWVLHLGLIAVVARRLMLANEGVSRAEPAGG